MFTYKTFDAKTFKTDSFNLTPIELRDYITFEPKRIYYVCDFTGDTGSHCHLVEEELFWVVKGSMTAEIDNGDGQGKRQIEMSAEECNGLYVANYVWHQFKNASKDAVLLAISSTNYTPDRSDYIEDYAEYQETIKSMK